MTNPFSSYQVIVSIAIFFARHAWCAYLLIAAGATVALTPITSAQRPLRFLTIRHKSRTSPQIP